MILTLTVLVNVVAMSPSNNRKLSVQLLQLPMLNLRYLRCSATSFHLSHSRVHKLNETAALVVARS